MRSGEEYPQQLWSSIGKAWLGSIQAGYQVACLNTALDHAIDPGCLLGIRSTAVLLGGFLGALAAAKASAWLGPRSAQIYNALLSILGSCLSSMVWWSHPGFLAGRLLAGLAAGANAVQVHEYVSDVLPHALKESAISHQHSVMVCVGVVLAMLAGLPYQIGVDSVQLAGMELAWWQVMLGAAALPAVLQVLLLLGCPESPAWLETHDKEKADEACIKLWGSHAILYEAPLPTSPQHQPRFARSTSTAVTASSDQLPTPTGAFGSSVDKLSDRARSWPNYGEPDEGLTATLLAHDSDASDAELTEHWWTTAQQYEYRRIMLLALGLPALAQAAGGASVLLFSSQMLPELAYPEELPVGWGCVLLALAYLAGSCSSTRLAKLAGAKRALMSSFVGMAFSLFTSAIISVYQQLYQPPTSPVPGAHLGRSWATSASTSASWQALRLAPHLQTASALASVEQAGAPPTPPSQACGCKLDVANCVLLVAYTLFFGLGTGPTLWQYVDETLPTLLKGPVSGLSTALSWATSFIVAVTALPAIHGPIGIGGLFLAYGLFAILGLMLVSTAMIDSYGLSRNELQHLLLLSPKPQLRNLFPVPGAPSQRQPAAPTHGAKAKAVDITRMATQAWARWTQQQVKTPHYEVAEPVCESL